MLNPIFSKKVQGQKHPGNGMAQWRISASQSLSELIGFMNEYEENVVWFNVNACLYLFVMRFVCYSQSFQLLFSWVDLLMGHDDVMKWKHFPRYWPFVRGIHRSPVNSHTKASDAELCYFLVCARINGWVNNGEAGDLRRHCARYDAIVMYAYKMRHMVYWVRSMSCFQ